MNAHNSPEERLLHLIKGQKAQPSAQVSAPPAPQALPASGSQAVSLPLARIERSLWPKTSQVIAIAFLGACIFLISSFVYPLFVPKNIKLPQPTKQEISRLALPQPQETKPIDFYQEAIQKHAIFTAPAAVEATKPIGIASADLIKDMALVGIISGDNPQAIVEDKKAHKTYYVNKGQVIGEFQVEDILEGRIILNSNGQKYELYL